MEIAPKIKKGLVFIGDKVLIVVNWSWSVAQYTQYPLINNVVEIREMTAENRTNQDDQHPFSSELPLISAQKPAFHDRG